MSKVVGLVDENFEMIIKTKKSHFTDYMKLTTFLRKKKTKDQTSTKDLWFQIFNKNLSW